MTNGDVAYYFYRPSREGAFLRELLKDFSGVLVSDFFTAYDSLEVRQQRCLIHLLRDLNEELLKAPYDEELRMLGDQFAAVLGPIVKTIDDHGLKRWHLSKHKTAVGSSPGGLPAQTLSRDLPPSYEQGLRNTRKCFLHSWTTTV